MVTFCLFRARENSFRFFFLLVRLFELHSSHPGVSFKRDTLFTICLRVVVVFAVFCCACTVKHILWPLLHCSMDVGFGLPFDCSLQQSLPK